MHKWIATSAIMLILAFTLSHIGSIQVMASNFILGLTALFAAPKIVSAQTACSDLVAEVGSGAQIQIASSATVAATGLNISSLGKSTNTDSICRIQANIPYGLNHTLGVELWLPENWNGRYISVGESLCSCSIHSNINRKRWSGRIY